MPLLKYNCEHKIIGKNINYASQKYCLYCVTKSNYAIKGNYNFFF